MSLEEWELNVQVENPVDLISLARHGCDLRSIYQAQDLIEYFNMINGPTYLTLIRHFWVRAEIYDLKASQLQMEEKILIDPSLQGKTREEMGLELFRQEEIRSSIMGLSVVIFVDTIAGAIRRASEGRFVYGLNSKKSSWIPVVKRTLYHSVNNGRYKDLDMKTKVLLKIQNENLLPKGSGGDKPSLDHQVFLHLFLTKEKANVLKFIFTHLMKNLKDSQTIHRNFVPYGRLLSEIFYQGGILNSLKEVNYFTDAQLSTVTGRIINGATLVAMKLIKKQDLKQLSTDLKESFVISNLIDDFPPICKQDPLEVRVMFMKEYFETTGKVIKISDIPDEMYGGALPIAKNKKSLKRKMTEAEYLEDTSEPVAKVAKTSVPISSDVLPQQEDPEDEDSEPLIRKRKRVEQVDSEQVITVESGTSTSSLSSNSTDFDENSQNIADHINRHSQKTDPTSTSSYPIPLQVILPEPVAETVVPAPVPAAESEPSAAATVHTHIINQTPEKATTSVSIQTDIVNQQQQQPEPSNQTTTEQTSISTQLTQTQTTHSPQKTIPEPVVETVVSESVPVTESGPSVAITVSDPTKNSNNQQTTNDQPSSSSTIQTPKTTIPHLLKSEVLESEVMNMHAELQRLVQLRRSSALTDDYQGRWASLNDRTSELLDTVNQKCIRIQLAANMHRTKPVQLIEEDPAPLLLTYTPFYRKSEYLTTEGRIVKQVKEEALKEKAAAKAREDLLIQKQLEMEAAFKRQADLLAQLMNKQT